MSSPLNPEAIWYFFPFFCFHSSPAPSRTATLLLCRVHFLRSMLKFRLQIISTLLPCSFWQLDISFPSVHQAKGCGNELFGFSKDN
ncbi:hypothetical protein A4A49_22600 [Nicotiana attenuata]|uniref:Uncharacterized protein n=1 Tax=Nicotiana attenuata TaxID=49451 RepID=A0A314KIK7_NICAT|nr:hypothetical protein A4A49_22600 [Nicotiana attenuata]